MGKINFMYTADTKLHWNRLSDIANEMWLWTAVQTDEIMDMCCLLYLHCMHFMQGTHIIVLLLDLLLLNFFILLLCEIYLLQNAEGDRG
jgi:hypothetical protein